MNLITRFGLFGIAAALCTPFSRAQVLEKDVITVPVKIEGRFTHNSGNAMSVNFASVQAAYYTDLGSDTYEVSVDPESDPQMASPKPGQVYTMTVYLASGATNTVVQLSPPPGYRVYIDDVRTSRISGLPSGASYYNVRVEAETTVPFGQPSSLRAGRIVWSVGLGNLSNGRSAGSISVRRPVNSGNGVQPSDLIYDSASPEFEVTNEIGGVRQIYVTNGLVEITAPTSTATKLRFYRRVQVGNKVNGLYTLTGNPLYEYVIALNSGSAVASKLTDQGGATRSEGTQLLLGSGSAGRLFDWADSQGWPAAGLTIKVTDSNGATVAMKATGVYVDDYYYQNGVIAWERRTYDDSGQLNGNMRLLNNSWFSENTWGYENGVLTSETHLDPRRPKQVLYSLHSDLDRKWQHSTKTEYFNDTANAKVTSIDYEADWTGRKTLFKSSVTVVSGVTLAKTEVTYANTTIADSSRTYQGSNALPALVATTRDYYDATHYLTTVTKTYRDDADPQYRFFPGMTHSIKRADGTVTVNLFFRGTFSLSTRSFTPAQDGPEVMKLTLNGTVATTGTDLLTSYTLGTQTQPTESDFRVLPSVSTAQAVVMAADGTVICTQSMLYDGSGWPVTQRDVHEYADQFFLATTTRDSGNTANVWPIVTNTWSAGRLTASVDETGVRTDYTYDLVGRVATKTRIGASGLGATLAAITTTYEYDAVGHVTKETVGAAGTGETLVTVRAFDLAERLVSESKPGAGATVLAYQNSMSSSRQLTATLPSGSTSVDDYYLDGRIKQKQGTGVVAASYTYATETDGRHRTSVTAGGITTDQWTDMVGRSVKTSRPGFTGQSASEETSVFDDYTGTSTGRLLKTTKTGFAPSLFSYNSVSQLVRSGVDIDSGGTLVLASGDRITDSNEVFEYFDSAWWATKTATNYPFTNSSTAKEIGKTRTRLTGLTSSLRGETRSYDAEGNETRVTITVDAANKVVTTTTKRPGMANDAVEKSLNGFVVEATGPDGLTFAKRYDALGRPSKEIDPRTGTGTYATVSTTYITNSPLLYETRDATNRVLARYGYDAAGRTIYAEDALGKTTRTAYTLRGEVEKVWGSATYPVTYAYDSGGRRTAMTSYRDLSGAATADSTTWPSSLGTGDTTTWEFDGPSGLLKKKTDAKGKFVEYAYNVRGQTDQRFWSRTLPSSSTRVAATYSYDSATGENTGITYNDGTPAVTYAFTRSSLLDAVTDVTGTHDFVYDSTKPWRLSAEAFDTFYGSRLLTPTYESTLSTNTGVTSYTGHTLGSVPGRLSGVKLGTSGTPADDLEFAYAASNAGRFAGLVASRDNGAASRQFVYGYETNSALVKSLAVVSNAFFVTRDFEANRDLLTNVETKWSTTTRTKFAYAYDDRRLRQSVVQSGDVFADYGGTDSGAIHQIFTYNARGEVTAAGTFLGATATDQSTPLSARKHEFDYDGIGNRKWSNTSGVGGIRDQYVTNELNQYVLRENNTLAVGGVADADAKVAVRFSALAGRAGKHWGDNLTLDNWAYPFKGNISIYSVNSTANTKEIVTRTAFLPPAAQSFAYDADGNLTNDGVWAYSWDAENRLTAMETTAGAVMGGMTAQRLEFKYDYMNRRVEKLVRGGWNGTTYATITAQRRYLYDGWSLLAEFSVSGTTLTKVRTYAWGLDIARSLKDAGGVGALLQIRDHASGKDYFPSYDGNGNIAALFDASDGSVGAAYEYSPYGEFLRCEGTYAKENPFRFSTKFTDDETGLVYYGRRYYDPCNGRFVGRDPIEEQGGLNLYGFCGNNGVNRWDMLGMESPATITTGVIAPDGKQTDTTMYYRNGPYGMGYYSTSAPASTYTEGYSNASDDGGDFYGATTDDVMANTSSGGGAGTPKVNLEPDKRAIRDALQKFFESYQPDHLKDLSKEDLERAKRIFEKAVEKAKDQGQSPEHQQKMKDRVEELQKEIDRRSQPPTPDGPKITPSTPPSTIPWWSRLPLPFMIVPPSMAPRPPPEGILDPSRPPPTI